MYTSINRRQYHVFSWRWWCTYQHHCSCFLEGVPLYHNRTNIVLLLIVDPTVVLIGTPQWIYSPLVLCTLLLIAVITSIKSVCAHTLCPSLLPWCQFANLPRFPSNNTMGNSLWHFKSIIWYGGALLSMPGSLAWFICLVSQMLNIRIMPSRVITSLSRSPSSCIISTQLLLLWWGPFESIIWKGGYYNVHGYYFSADPSNPSFDERGMINFVSAATTAITLSDSVTSMVWFISS